MSTVRSTFSYMPAFDGLRTVAIAVVILAHTHMFPPRGSYLAVDMFFLLSGFLLTLHLQSEFDLHGNVDIVRFYIRRILRLVPAMLLMIIGVCGFVAVAYPAELFVTLRDAGAVVLWVSNITRAMDFDMPYLFGHTWALAAEMQFYLLWPFIVIPCLRLRSTTKAVSILSAIAVIVIVHRIALVNSDAGIMRLFNGFDTRADGFLAGAICSFFVADCVKNESKYSFFRAAVRYGVWPACCVLTGLLLYEDWQNRQAYVWIIPLAVVCAGILMSHLALYRDGRMARWFSSRPLVLLASFSYGTYLWHYPVFILVHRQGYSTVLSAVIAGTIVIAMSYGSFVLVERPCLRFQKYFRRRIESFPSPIEQVSSGALMLMHEVFCETRALA